MKKTNFTILKQVPMVFALMAFMLLWQTQSMGQCPPGKAISTIAGADFESGFGDFTQDATDGGDRWGHGV